MSASSSQASLWREVLDQHTGRKYYYHLITRETTWVKPKALEEPAAVEAEEDDDPLFGEDAAKKEAAVGRLIQTFASIRNRFTSEFLNVLSAVHGLQQFKVLCSGSLGHQARCECISMLVGGCEGGSVEALCSMGFAPLLLEVALEKDDRIYSSRTRTKALHVLCKIASLPALHHMLLQASEMKWEQLLLPEDGAGLRAGEAHWEDWDLSICLLFCLLLTGPSAAALPSCITTLYSIIRNKLQALIETITSEAFYHSGRNGGNRLPLPITGGDLTCINQLLTASGSSLFAAAKDDEHLLLRFLVWYLTLLCQDAEQAEQFISIGGIGILQVLCLEPSTEVSKAASRLMLDMMHQHQSVATQILESWISLGSDLTLGLFRSSPAGLLQHHQGSDISKGGHELGAADTFLEIGQSRLPVHKAILIARSSLLRDLVLQQPEEVIFSFHHMNIPEAFVQVLLVHLYTGISLVPGDVHEVLELLQVAHRLRLGSLIGACERVLLLTHISVATVQDILDVAEACGLPTLQNACKAFVRLSSSHATTTTSHGGKHSDGDGGEGEASADVMITHNNDGVGVTPLSSMEGLSSRGGHRSAFNGSSNDLHDESAGQGRRRLSAQEMMDDSQEDLPASSASKPGIKSVVPRRKLSSSGTRGSKTVKETARAGGEGRKGSASSVGSVGVKKEAQHPPHGSIYGALRGANGEEVGRKAGRAKPVSGREKRVLSTKLNSHQQGRKGGDMLLLKTRPAWDACSTSDDEGGGKGGEKCHHEAEQESPIMVDDLNLGYEELFGRRGLDRTEPPPSNGRGGAGGEEDFLVLGSRAPRSNILPGPDDQEEEVEGDDYLHPDLSPSRQAVAEAFVESIHSLRPPDPVKGGKELRAELRAMPKHVAQKEKGVGGAAAGGGVEDGSLSAASDIKSVRVGKDPLVSASHLSRGNEDLLVPTSHRSRGDEKEDIDIDDVEGINYDSSIGEFKSLADQPPPPVIREKLRLLKSKSRGSGSLSQSAASVDDAPPTAASASDSGGMLRASYLPPQPPSPTIDAMDRPRPAEGETDFLDRREASEGGSVFRRMMGAMWRSGAKVEEEEEGRLRAKQAAADEEEEAGEKRAESKEMEEDEEQEEEEEFLDEGEGWDGQQEEEGNGRLGLLDDGIDNIIAKENRDPSPLGIAPPPRRASSQSSAACTRKLGCTCEDCINDGVPLNVDLTAVPYPPPKDKFKESTSPRKTPVRNRRPKVERTPAATIRTKSSLLGDSGRGDKWRTESETLRSSIRAARKGGGFRNEDKPVESRAPLSNTSDFSASAVLAPSIDLIKCPTCHRRFNETAAERHIPMCSNIVAKPKRLTRGGGLNAASGAALKKRESGVGALGFSGSLNGNSSSRGGKGGGAAAAKGIHSPYR